MSYLNAYIKQENDWNAIFDKDYTPIQYPITDDKVAKSIFNSLDSKLSPENLMCDGERSMKDAKAWSDYYYNVGFELLQAGFDASYSENFYCYEMKNGQLVKKKTTW